MRLYELTDEWLALEDALEESGGELTPEIEEQMDALEALTAAKVDNIAKLLRQWEADAAAASAERDALATKAATRKRQIDSLKAYVLREMNRRGVQRVDGDAFTVRKQVNSAPSVVLTVPPSDLPAEFQRVTVDADKRVLVELWRDGSPLPSGVRIERGEHVRVS